MAATRDDVRSRDGSPAEPSRTRNPASAVYGTVLAGSLIAVEGAAGVGLGRLVVLVLVTQLVYWLAHTYADLVGGRIRTGHRPHRGEVAHVLAEEWPLVTASFEPLAVTVIARAAGADLATAATLGLWAGTLMLAGWAVFAGLRARLRWPEMLLYVALSTAFGAGLVLLKVLLH